jgi:hypothetical protein
VGELVVLVEEVAPGDGGGGRAGEEGGQPHPQHEAHPVRGQATFAASLARPAFGDAAKQRGLRKSRARAGCDGRWWVLLDLELERPSPLGRHQHLQMGPACQLSCLTTQAQQQLCSAQKRASKICGFVSVNEN